jgi:amino acid permease
MPCIGVGNLWTAGGHIITTVIGSGILSLAWCMAQLGWIAGIAATLIFSAITYYTSCLLVDCYRSGHPTKGKHNPSYIDAVRENLGKKQIWLCGLVKYMSLYGAAIGYTITASLSMVAIERSNCFHKNGHNTLCDFSNNNFTILFGFAEMILSQIPNFDQAWWILVAAAHTCYLVAEENFE